MEIQFSGVSKTFPPDINALENIYLNVDKGEFVYLIGETGSGKTTLMRCIFREVVPSRGHISVGGHALRKMGRFELALFRRDIGVVFQDFALLPNLTAFENVAFVLEIMGMPKREIDARVTDALKTMGIWRRRALYPQQMSGGEQQRLAIARAVVNEPSLLLADEPTGNLDEANENIVLEIFKKLHEEGTTLIVVTHDPEVGEVAQRTVILDHGKIKSDLKNENFGK